MLSAQIASSTCIPHFPHLAKNVRISSNVRRSPFCVQATAEEAPSGKANKTDLVDLVAKQLGKSNAEAARAVDATLSAITSSILAGKKVAVLGFGSFEVRHRKGRAGRNPKTGEELQIPASNTIGFTPAKKMKDALNTKPDASVSEPKKAPPKPKK